MLTPREYTADELREQFVQQVTTLIRLWVSAPDAPLAQLQGLALDILRLLDEGGTHLPRFLVVPLPEEDDKPRHQDEGDNWYAENHEVAEDLACNISGALYSCLRAQLHNIKGLKRVDDTGIS